MAPFLFLKELQSESGFSLLSTVISIGIAGILIASIAKMTNNMQASSNSSLARQDIAGIKKAIIEGLDCRATLGVTSTTTLPMANCPTVSSIKRRNGNNLAGAGNKIGKWTVVAGCENGKGVTVELTRPGLDPLTKKPWNSLSYTKLTDGAGFCGSYFNFSSTATIAQCAANQEMRGIRPDGTPYCVDRPAITSNSCPPNAEPYGIDANGNVACRVKTYNTSVCPPNSQMVGLQANGLPNCVPIKNNRPATQCRWVNRTQISAIGGDLGSAGPRSAADSQNWSGTDSWGNIGDGNVACPAGEMVSGIHCGGNCSDGFAILCCSW